MSDEPEIIPLDPETHEYLSRIGQAHGVSLAELVAAILQRVVRDNIKADYGEMLCPSRKIH